MTSSSDLLVLAIDTAQEDCAAALWRGGRILASCVEHAGSRHAERILSLIDEALAQAGESKASIGLAAFGAGPGSFTGLRVACGTAQGIAWALGVKTAPVPNLEALAQAAARRAVLKPGERVAAVNDARMHECYAAVYAVPEGGLDSARLVPVDGPVLVKPAEAGEYIAQHGAALAVGSAPAAYPDLAKVPEGVRFDGNFHAAPEEIARIAALMAANGGTLTPELAAPIYVRDRVALTMAERARGERL